jgi:2-methylcitrate dehydratase PrpD
MNGVLIHGLDYDDTHLEGVVHASASCFSCAFGVAAEVDASGRDLLAAYIAGLEVIARIGMVAKGGLHLNGLHPTGTLAAFASSLIAGKLMGLDAEQLTMAQGNALSTAAVSSRQYGLEGAWTKRVHPGWGAAAGITAAALARGGTIGPRQVYEGDYSVYRTLTATRYEQCDLSLATQDLGRVWESARVAVKPIPACHLVHACSDAAVALAQAHTIDAAQTQSIRARVPEQAFPIVCEPEAKRRRPVSSYAAQFSIYHAVAASLLRKKFGLAEMEPAVYNDPAVLALSDKVSYERDTQSEYPKYFSGELVITLNDGRELRHREHINRGAADRPIVRADIAKKFFDNATLAVSRSRAQHISDAVFALDHARARTLETSLALE